MNKILLLLACVVGFSAFSQSARLKKANKEFSSLSYAYSAQLYTKLLGSEEDNVGLRSKLAYSYLQTNQFIKAIEVYSTIAELPDVPSSDFYNYSYALKVMGNYTESDFWMLKYANAQPNEIRVKLFLANPDYKAMIEALPPFFELSSSTLNSSYNDFGGYLNKPMSHIYLISTRKRNPMVENEWSWDAKRFFDIYYAPYSSADTRGKIKKMPKVNTKFHEGPMTFSLDGKTVYFTRNNLVRSKKGRDKNHILNLKIYIADVDTKGRFVNEREFTHNSTDYSVGHPALSADGSKLYFVSDKPGGFGETDLYVCSINGNNQFGEMMNLGASINTEGREMFPFLDAAGRLFFSSDGRPGLGGLDVYAAETKGNLFKEIINLGHTVNSRFDDFAFLMTDGVQTGYTSSNRSGLDHIYSTKALTPIVFGVSLKGTIKDKKGNLVPLATVEIIGENELVLATLIADENGVFEWDGDYDKTYLIKAGKEKYFPGKTSVNTRTTEIELDFDVIIEKDPGMSMVGIVKDSRTHEPLEGVNVYLVDNFTDQAKKLVTPEDGMFLEALTNKKLNDRGSYNILLEKDGYFTKSFTINTVFDKDGQYNLNSLLDLSLEREVKDLGEMVQLNAINFDLGKSLIRPDAAKELDKIVDIMNRYPHLVIELGAHTDCTGSAKTNESLSQKRAAASAEYIKKRISSPERVFGKGYGSTRLLNDCDCKSPKGRNCSDEEHAVNRRTEFRVIATGNDKLKVEKPLVESFDEY